MPLLVDQYADQVGGQAVFDCFQGALIDEVFGILEGSGFFRGLFPSTDSEHLRLEASPMVEGEDE
jgi:hypothetical protein